MTGDREEKIGEESEITAICRNTHKNNKSTGHWGKRTSADAIQCHHGTKQEERVTLVHYP